LTSAEGLRVHPRRPFLDRHVPACLAALDAAPLAQAGITAYKRIMESGARAGNGSLAAGVGGLGHLAIQYAKSTGFLFCAISLDEGKLTHARRVGAPVADLARRMCAEIIKRLENSGFA
jgi:propanol-preferring alcohol dehydrogenase